jgi:hypothetical protein
MKYVVSWTARSAAVSEADAKRSLSAFTNWTPASTATFHQFVQRVDGEGGFAIVETDDPANILSDTLKFAPWFKYECFPVIDIMDAVSAFQEAIDYRDSLK